jgi:hypothetical protein
MIVFYIISDINHVIAQVGAQDEDQFRAIVKSAEELNLNCMPFIDYVGDTILNQKQLRMLKNELIKLQALVCNSDDLEIWLVAVNKALENSSYYLLINGE